MEEEIIKNYLADVPCGYCGQQYVPANIELVKQSGRYYTFSIYCHYCNRQNFVTVFVNNSGATKPEIELTEAETEKFCSPVCSDDVLDLHTFLNGFDGDFSALFPDIKLEDNSKPQKKAKGSTTSNNIPEHGELEET